MVNKNRRMSAAVVASAGSSGKAKNFAAKCYSVSSRPRTNVMTRPRRLTAATIPRTAGTPNLPFKIGRTKTPTVAPILATLAANPLAVARNCVGNRIGARVNVVALGPAFINKLNRMNPANTSGMCPAPAGEFDR